MITDPILKRFVARAYKNGHGELHLKSTEAVRDHLESLKPPVQVHCQFEDYAPESNIQFRIYRHPNPLKTILYIRASAYTGGGKLDDTNGICDMVRHTLQAHVVSLNFRTPPEHKFPCYFEDVRDTTDWIYQNRDSLQLSGPWISWGESSGGAIVASLNQYLSKQHRNFFAAQVLIYPMLDLITESPSRKAYASGYMLDVAMIKWLEKRVLNTLDERSDYRASPGLHPMPHLPPLIMITCECDPLRDEGQQYARQLEHLGTPVVSMCVPNMIHGFMRYYKKIAAANDVMQWLKVSLEQIPTHPI